MERLWCQVKALQVKKRAPSVPKQLRRWKKHDCMKQLRQEPSNEAIEHDTNHIYHMNHIGILTTFSITLIFFMLFPDENELFYVISIDAIDVLQVLCKKWVRFRSQICQIRLPQKHGQFEWQLISRSVQMKVEDSIRSRNILQLRSALSEGQVAPWWIC